MIYKSSKYLKTSFVVLIAYFFVIQRICSQDLTYSQFFSSPMQINPALTGISKAINININYRNQWPELNNAFNTYAISLNKYLPELNSGLGFLFEGDIAGNGILNEYRGGLFYAYDIRFNKSYSIRMGLNADFIHKRLKWNNLIFFDQLDLATGPNDINGNPNPLNETIGKQSITYFDMGAGFLFNAPFIYAGISLRHLTVPIESYINSSVNDAAQLPLSINIHVGSKINLDLNNKKESGTFLSPNVMFISQGIYKQINFGTHIDHKAFIGGFYFRHTFSNSDAIIFMVGIKKSFLKICYSYDLTISSLGINTGGAHEVSILMSFYNFKKNIANRYNDCLEIFR